MAMEKINCNLCGSGRYWVLYEKSDEHFFPDDFFSVVECLDCGLGFVNPRPTVKEMPRYYPKNFYLSFQANHEKDLARFAAQSEYLTRVQREQRKPRLLDIGCANGDFLDLMRLKDWDVEGVETYMTTQDNDRFHVFNCQFSEVPIKTPSYDAVTAWAVLEHVHDPKAYFRKAAEVLHRGGIFVFMIPNFDSLASRKLFAEDVPRHLYFFTEANVRRYAKEAGFALELADYSNPIFVLDPHRFLHYLIARIMGRKFVWALKTSFGEFVRSNNLSRSPLSFIRFGLRHPVGLLDRVFAPLVGRLERLIGRYGIVVYVVRKL